MHTAVVGVVHVHVHVLVHVLHAHFLRRVANVIGLAAGWVALVAVRTAAHIDARGRRWFDAGARRRHLHHGRRRQGSTLVPAVAGHATPRDANNNNQQQNKGDDAADNADDESVVVGDGADAGRFDGSGSRFGVSHSRLGRRRCHRPNDFRLEVGRRPLRGGRGGRRRRFGASRAADELCIGKLLQRLALELDGAVAVDVVDGGVRQQPPLEQHRVAVAFDGVALEAEHAQPVLAAVQRGEQGAGQRAQFAVAHVQSEVRGARHGQQKGGCQRGDRGFAQSDYQGR